MPRPIVAAANRWPHLLQFSFNHEPTSANGSGLAFVVECSTASSHSVDRECLQGSAPGSCIGHDFKYTAAMGTCTLASLQAFCCGIAASNIFGPNQGAANTWIQRASAFRDAAPTGDAQPATCKCCSFQLRSRRVVLRRSRLLLQWTEYTIGHNLSWPCSPHAVYGCATTCCHMGRPSPAIFRRHRRGTQ